MVHAPKTWPFPRGVSSRTERSPTSNSLYVVSSLEAATGPRLWRWPAAASRCLSRGGGPSWGPRAVCRSAEGPPCCDSSADTTQRTATRARRGEAAGRGLEWTERAGVDGEGPSAHVSTDTPSFGPLNTLTLSGHTERRPASLYS